MKKNLAGEVSRLARLACQTFLLARSRLGAYSQASYITMWIQEKGETCDVHGYSTRFKSRFKGRMFVVRFMFFPALTP